jgi:ribose transport system permease protein
MSRDKELMLDTGAPNVDAVPAADRALDEAQPGTGSVPRPDDEAPSRRRLSPVAMAYVAVVVLAIVGQITSSEFLTFDHISVLLGVAAVLGIAAAGQTIVVLSAGIDLSVGAVISAAVVLTVQWTQNASSPVLIVVAIIALGAAVGVLNGVGVSLLGISPLVMTLGMAAIVGGFVLVVTNGESGGQAAAGIQDAMTGKLLGLPGTVWAWVVVAVLMIVLLRYSRLGRAVYAFGSNSRAARLAGLRPARTLVLVYAVAGAAAAAAGVVLAGYTGTGAYGIGNQYTLMSVAAVVVGGASILGGRGSYVGTIAGVVILAMLDDILTVADVAIAGRQIVQGLAILLILIVYGRERRMRTVS